MFVSDRKIILCLLTSSKQVSKRFSLSSICWNTSSLLSFSFSSGVRFFSWEWLFILLVRKEMSINKKIQSIQYDYYYSIGLIVPKFYCRCHCNANFLPPSFWTWWSKGSDSLPPSKFECQRLHCSFCTLAWTAPPCLKIIIPPHS